MIRLMAFSAIVAALVCAPTIASAESEGRSGFGLGFTTLTQHGFGIMARARASRVAFDATCGVYPVLVMYEESDQYGDTEPEMEIGMPVAVTGSMVVFFNPGSRFENGFRVGGIYNMALGYGGSFGWVGEINTQNWGISFGAGFHYFPEYERYVKDYFDLDDNLDMQAGEVQVYAGVNFIRYF